MVFQMVTPYDYSRKIVEKFIQTFRNHLVSILCGMDDNFPMHLWELMLQQAGLTLNLLRNSRLVPTITAYNIFYGTHN